MFSYGTINLPVAQADLTEWINYNTRPEDLYEFPETTWPGPSRQGWPWSFMPLPPVRLNTLRWPVGAARWAVGHFLISEGLLTNLRSQAYPTSIQSNYVSLPLTINDATRSVTTNMWMLPAVPISTAVAGAGLFILTLVDERWFWWQRANNIVVTEGITTWQSLYSRIASELQTTIIADPINTNYLKPSQSLSSLYLPLPLLLDAVARSIGQRIVRSLGGVTYAQNPSTALASANAQLGLDYKKYAGGKFALTPG